MEVLPDATLNDRLDERAAFEPNGFPVVGALLRYRL